MTPPGLILHPKTLAEAQRFLQRPTHALLLHGPLGSGKQSLALWLASELLGVSEEGLRTHPYFLLTDPATPSISIETVRAQQQFLRLKTIGSQPFRRLVLLPNVERMTTEAQNAFLKTLEEPPSDTVLLLTTPNHRELLPTMLSRVQQLPVQPPAEAALKQHFSGRYPTPAIDRAYLLSGGLPGLMAALLEQDQSHPLAVAIQQAKALLQASTFERLGLVDTLSKQKAEQPHLLQALKQIAETGLQQAARQQDTARLRRWHRVLIAAQTAQAALEKNANAKLLFTNLMLAL